MFQTQYQNSGRSRIEIYCRFDGHLEVYKPVPLAVFLRANMTSSPAELERELFGLLVDARTTNEMAVAAFTVVALEHIANFPAEVAIEPVVRTKPLTDQFGLEIPLEHFQRIICLSGTLVAALFYSENWLLPPFSSSPPILFSFCVSGSCTGDQGSCSTS
ncbi:hypothetical protein C8R47DRAFT_1149641 [Mycena vitilis]|nr:hypothetical protein C8R47DRAFT_1149641 [Mycena vitilis]